VAVAAQQQKAASEGSKRAEPPRSKLLSSFALHACMRTLGPRILTATSGRTGCTRPSLSDWWHQLLHSVVCRPEDYMYMLLCICNQLLQQVRVRRLYGVHANNENGHCVRVLLDLKDAHC
jgi:hypothetical protein